MNKIYSIKLTIVSLVLAMVTASIPIETYALRPMASNVSLKAGSAGEVNPGDNASSHKPAPSDAGISKRRVFLAALALGIVGVAATKIGLEKTDSTKPAAVKPAEIKPPEKEETALTLEQGIAKLNPDELAQKALFLFGSDERYKPFLSRIKDWSLPVGAQEEYKPESAADKAVWEFIKFYTESELQSVVQEALGREISGKEVDREAVAEALNKKYHEILLSAHAQSIHKKIAQVKEKEQQLAIFLRTVYNLAHAYFFAGLSQENFISLLEINGLSGLLKDFPQLLSLAQLFDVKSGKASALRELNIKFLIPHGFYASPELYNSYLAGRDNRWFYKIRDELSFGERKIFVLQRVRDDGERFKEITWFLTPQPQKDEPAAVVFHEEIADEEESCLAITQGREKYRLIELVPLLGIPQKIKEEFESQIPPMLRKAQAENKELENPGALKAYHTFSILLQALGHKMSAVSDKKMVPFLVELAYGEPHIAAKRMAERMIIGNNWFYTEVFSPIIWPEKEDHRLPPLASDIYKSKLEAIKAFIGMDRELIQRRAKDLLRQKEPSIYEAFESADGKRFREETLRALKAHNIGAETAKTSIGNNAKTAVIAALGAALLKTAVVDNAPMSRRDFITLGTDAGAAPTPSTVTKPTSNLGCDHDFRKAILSSA